MFGALKSIFILLVLYMVVTAGMEPITYVAKYLAL